MSEVRFSRTALLVGSEAMAKLSNSRVAIIGLGGVGSYAVEALARAGIGHFTLVDFDVVGESNFNRQLHALNHTLGEPKTEVMKKHIEDINPAAEVITYPVFLDSTNREEILKDQDFYLDAIDSLGPKCGLLEYAVKNNFKIISVMGSGNRLNPEEIHLAPLNETVNCPLARRVRKHLKRWGVDCNFPCVYSSELPKKIFKDISSPDEDLIHRGRERGKVGTISYMPAIMGMMAASWIIRQIVE